ncbi:hypothetical protein [Allokutzneria oryzae]|uniref:Uncharacterized protein n=1 Tax=Allokutzneria oryzae TaxID=1378989 RepID=A0ABV5ZNC4_9PSEU
MGSSFGRSRGEAEAALYLSSGGTAVFLDVLALAACDLAESEWDRPDRRQVADQRGNRVAGGDRPGRQARGSPL